MARKMTGGIPNVRERLPGASVALADAITRATAPDLVMRWGSAAEFAAAIRSLDEWDPMPTELKPLRGAGTPWVLGVVPGAFAGFLVYGQVTDGASLLARLLVPPLLGALTAAALACARLWGLRSEHAPGRSWNTLLPILLRQPTSWHGWWPQAWRGPNVLDRLPTWMSRIMRRGVRVLQWQLPFAAVMAVVMTVYAVLTPDELARLMSTSGWTVAMLFMRWLWVPMLAVLPVVVVGAVRLNRELGRRGIAPVQFQRFLQSPEDPAHWQSTWMRLLLDEAPATSGDVPRELAALLDGVAALASALRGAGWPIDDFAPFLSDARDADTQWAREQEELAADADPAEAGRLRERLEKLRAASARGAAQDEMIALQERQLALHEQAETRRLAIEAQRARLRDGCALVYRQLRALRADDALRAGAGEVTGRVRALTTDLARLRAAAEEAGR